MSAALAAIPLLPIGDEKHAATSGPLLQETLVLEAPAEGHPQTFESVFGDRPISLQTASSSSSVSQTTTDPVAVLPHIDALFKGKPPEVVVKMRCAAISAAGRLKRPDVALAVFRELRALGPVAPEAHSALLHAFALNRRMDKAYALVEFMKSEGIAPSLLDWTTLMHGYLKEQNYAAAWKMYDGLKSYTNEKPDELTYQVMIRTCAAQGLVDKGYNLFQEMEHVAALTPNRSVFHAMLLLYGSRKGYLREAEELQLRMEGYGYLPDVGTYALMFHAIAKNGDLLNLKRWLRKLQSSGLSPNIHIYNQVLLCHVNALRRRESTTAEPREHNLRPKVDSAEIAASVKETFALMQAQGIPPTVVTLNAMLRITSLTEGRDASILFWKSEYARFGIVPNAYSFFAYATMFCEIGEVEKAELLVDEMIRRDLDPPGALIRQVMEAHLTSGAPDGVDKCFAWMHMLEDAGHPLEPWQLCRLQTKMDQSRFKREMVNRMQLLKDRLGEEGVAQLPQPQHGTADPQRRAKVTHYDHWLERLTKYDGDEDKPIVPEFQQKWWRSLQAARQSKYYGVQTRGGGTMSAAWS